ncbi:MAG: glucose-1-phosphate cytidylyltransferase [Nanoarchaeota archaeon]|nr:glucose-1-phosphate cytidylyltransferase [Nanoarchaeota archaeon]
MKVAILCGGEGTRIREHTESIPKALIEIGDKPIIWHIMKIYASYGYNDFILCLGYKGHLIKEYFLNYNSLKNSDFTLNFGSEAENIKVHNNNMEKWNITFVETGLKSNKAERLKKVREHITEDEFFLAYGDDLSDVNINELLYQHRNTGNIITLTAIKPISQFGVFEIDNDNKITQFKEKPRMKDWINGGFFVMNRKVFDYIKEGYDLERETFEELVRDKKIGVFKHDGFWECMNTFKDAQKLDHLWKKGDAPWRRW